MKGLGVWREFGCSAVDETVVSNSGTVCAAVNSSELKTVPLALIVTVIEFSSILLLK